MSYPNMRMNPTFKGVIQSRLHAVQVMSYAIANDTFWTARPEIGDLNPISYAHYFQSRDVFVFDPRSVANGVWEDGLAYQWTEEILGAKLSFPSQKSPMDRRLMKLEFPPLLINQCCVELVAYFSFADNQMWRKSGEELAWIL